MSSVINTYVAPSSEAALQPLTLDGLLRRRAAQSPAVIAYTFLGSEGEEQASLTYKELDRQARVIAAYLQLLNVAGERASCCSTRRASSSSSPSSAASTPAVSPSPPTRRAANRSHASAAVASSPMPAPALALTAASYSSRGRRAARAGSELARLRWLATDDARRTPVRLGASRRGRRRPWRSCSTPRARPRRRRA